MLKRNEGVIDRILRVTAATVLLPSGLFLLGGLQGNTAGLVVAGFSALPLLTGLTGFCPLYVPFGINTLEKEKEFVARFKSMAANCMAGGTNGAMRMCGPAPQPNDATHDQQA